MHISEHRAYYGGAGFGEMEFVCCAPLFILTVQICGLPFFNGYRICTVLKV